MKKRLYASAAFLANVVAIIFLPYAMGRLNDSLPPEWSWPVRVFALWVLGLFCLAGVFVVIAVPVFWVRWVVTGKKPFED